jgi:hypothetical protein
MRVSLCRCPTCPSRLRISNLASCPRFPVQAATTAWSGLRIRCLVVNGRIPICSNTGVFQLLRSLLTSHRFSSLQKSTPSLRVWLSPPMYAYRTNFRHSGLPSIRNYGMKWAPRLRPSLSATEFRRSGCRRTFAESISATFSHRPRSVEFEAGRQNGRYKSTKSPRAIPSDAAKYHGQGPRKSKSDGFLGLARRYM